MVRLGAMARHGLVWGLLVAWLLAAIPTPAAADREPARRPLVLAHVMPWYMARPFSPGWGWHWTMNRFDPEQVQNGRRSIASHYDPLIGPYDSGDPAVLEYHLLLMKLAGIDGVIVDWYGRSDLHDYALLHRNTERLIEAARRLGLRHAICYEDQTIPRLVEAGKLTAADRVRHARSEIQWLQDHWFREPGYVRLDDRPLLLSFGADGLTDAEWTAVLADLPGPPVYVSEHHRRSAAAGAFDWPIPGEYPASLARFEQASAGQKVAIPVAFPRFHDIYAEGKARPSLGRIADDDGQTWERTLDRALATGAPIVQLATWNDWGEGTGIEPTEQFGFRDLEALQRRRQVGGAPGRPGTPADLRLPLRLYRLRTGQAEHPGRAQKLDAVAAWLASGQTERARQQLDRLDP